MVIIAQAGWGQANDMERTLNAGFDHRMLKPIDLHQLTKVLADLPDAE